LQFQHVYSNIKISLYHVCFGPADKTITGNDNPLVLEDLPEGVYQFRSADANGCIESPPFGVIVVTY